MIGRTGRDLGAAGRILRVAGLLVPGGRREEWIEEWESEMWHWQQRRLRAAKPAPSKLAMALRCLGALPHALWVRKEEWTLDRIALDLRYALRQVRRSPGFVSVAVITLGLGIGANTTIFSLLNALLFRPPPGIHQPDRLVQVARQQTDRRFDTISYLNYVDLRDGTEALSDLVAYYPRTFFVGGGADTELLPGVMVTGNYFDALGVAPALGRMLTIADDVAPGAHPVLVISHRYWRRRFGGDPTAVGRSIQITGRAYEIVGVTPKGFVGTEIVGSAVDAWLPLSMVNEVVGSVNRLTSRGTSYLRMFGRLADETDVTQARAQLSVLGKRLRAAHPVNRSITGLAVIPGVGLRPSERVEVMGVGAVMGAVVAMVLLITCANLANLLLVRGSVRSREIGVRMALGAERGRIVRQLSTEGLVIAVGGALVAFLATFWTARLLPGVMPSAVAIDFTPDVRVFVFALTVAVVTTLLFGILPAIRASRIDVVDTLRGGARVEAGPPSRVRNGLVVAQLAVSLVLLVGSGLLLQSVRNAQNADPGFETRGVLLMTINVARAGYTAERGQQFYRDLLEQVGSAPGVRSVALAETVAIAQFPSGRGVLLEDRPLASGERPTELRYNVVTSSYFATLGMPIVRGRGFADTDGAESPLVAVVNEAMAEQHWPGENPVGKAIYLPRPGGPLRVEVVGVARNARMRSLLVPPQPFAFFPFAQEYDARMTLHVRTQGRAEAATTAVLDRIEALDGSVPVYGVSLLQDRVAGTMGATNMTARLITVFGGLALVLAAVGLYGVIAYGVERRRRELGLRIAIGATSSDVIGLVLKQGLTLSLIGAVVGVGGGMWATRFIDQLLFEVARTDVTTYGVITLLLVGVAIVASIVPAFRATRFGPMEALRSE